MSKNRISILVALEGTDKGLKNAIESAERSLNELATTAKRAGAKAADGFAQVKAGLSALNDQVGQVKGALLAFLTIDFVADKARQIISLADAWNAMNARLQLATAGSREYMVAQRELFDIAQRIGVPIQETATLYGKLQQAVRTLGGEQQDALAITESISQALRISGASAAESQGALLQFGQALSSGALRGDEFNSVMEASPRLMQAIADGMGVPIGALRNMAEQGRLTADVVVNALLSQKDRLAAEYAALPSTVGQAFARLQNAFIRWVGKLDESTGSTQKLSQALTILADNLDTVMEWLGRIAAVGLAVLVYRMIPALITAWQTAGAAAVAAASAMASAWATANLSVANAIATVGKLRVAFGVLGAAIIGWEIGTWLSEKFEIVRKAGIFMVEVLMKGIEQLRFQWEVFAAIFTSDTIAEATKRHEQRLAQMNGIFREMYADASRGSEAAAQAMNTAATTAEEIVARLQAVRQGTQQAIAVGIEAVHGALEKLKSRLGEVEQDVTKAQGVVNDAIAKMAESYKALTAQIETNLAQQVQAVKSRYDQEKAELERIQQSETARIVQSTQLLTDALTQQANLRRQATIETIALIDQEAQARKDAAARQGQTEEERKVNVQRVENEILAIKQQTLAQALTEYRQHIDALNTEINRHLSEVQRIEDAKRQLAMTTEERIREIQRMGMDEFAATEDRKRQIAEYQQQARLALLNGELEQANQYAQKAMDLAAQVASSQSSEAKRAEQARIQSMQTVAQIEQIEAQASAQRWAGNYAEYERLMQQADQMRADFAAKQAEYDAQIIASRRNVQDAVDSIRISEDLLNQSLDAEAKAHKTAAFEAVSARDAINNTLNATQSQINDIQVKLAEGLKLTLDADKTKFDAALAELDKALAEKAYLLKIQADLKEAEAQLIEYENLLKEGKTLPVDADVSMAREALAALKTYAEQNAHLDLKVSTERAQSAIGHVEDMILKLGAIQTESNHVIQHNADAARSEIASLDGMNTSSTHIIYVRRVEENATGGLVGGGIRHFADGGAVTPAFPRMSGGRVPGVGDGDTVPRTLDAGAYVIRKAAVRKYGVSALARLANGVVRFARGGSVLFGSSPGVSSKTASTCAPSSPDDDPRVKNLEGRIAIAKAELEKIKADLAAHPGKANQINSEVAYYAYWRERANLQKAIPDKEAEIKALELELVRLKNTRRFAGGGRAPAHSDTVPAMLTPGEFVVNRQAVARYGVGLFEAINTMSLPVQALAGHVMGFASGGLVPSASYIPPRPSLPDGTPTRTVRVELSSGQQKVNATIDARDEARLLQLLDAARARAS